ncbi:B Protein ADMP Small subunit of serine palmitoyltransferase [Triplophysa tibetana]|uniref:Serine palmitoyltransferase small subunit B n=1 Tax=Triplophysa tibetana TaxID=1572043 RepID=A0A5A9MZH3_9TELE|nr:B Protein ADMP Small subunit of serine palmitoyltransferase [Triplophysa tibetana]
MAASGGQHTTLTCWCHSTIQQNSTVALTFLLAMEREAPPSASPAEHRPRVTPRLSKYLWKREQARDFRSWRGGPVTPEPNVSLVTVKAVLRCSQQDGVALRVNMKTMREYVSWLYYQYLLITGIYVLEPWEKSIFNTLLFTMVVMVVYTSYVFVPIHVCLALEFFSGLARGHPESTVALMS